MTDAPKPPPPGAGAPTPHHHDWRVDPNQVIVIIRNENRVRIVCADEKCNAVAVVYTQPSTPAHPDKPKSWRKYVFKPTDLIKMEPDRFGRK